MHYGNYTLLRHSLKSKNSSVTNHFQSKNEGAEVQRVQLQPLHSFPRCEVQGAAATVILNRCCTCSTSVNMIRFLFQVFRFRIDNDECGLLQ